MATIRTLDDRPTIQGGRGSAWYTPGPKMVESHGALSLADFKKEAGRGGRYRRRAVWRLFRSLPNTGRGGDSEVRREMAE